MKNIGKRTFLGFKNIGKCTKLIVKNAGKRTFYKKIYYICT